LSAIWSLAATPFVWTILFWSFVLRARVALGHWPAPYQPDPKDLGFAVHYYLLLAGMPLALAAAIVVPIVVVLGFRSPTRSRARARWAATLAIAGGLGLVLWGQTDPGQFLSWLGD
jgi:hypothetical protein